MKRRVIASAAVAAFLICGAAIWHVVAKGSVVRPLPVAQTLIPVVAEKVVLKDVPIFLRGIGTVAAYNTDVVRSQIQGEIVQILFTEGQAVKAGDLLAQIDPRPYQAQIEQLTANRDRDSAHLANAQANLTRDAKLGDNGYATPQLIETQTAKVAQLQAAVRSDQAAIDQASLQLAYTKLTSAISGVTGVRQIDVGNVIHPSDTNGLVVVTQIEPISLIFTLPQSELASIQDQMATGSLEVSAYSQDDKQKLDVGQLLLIDNEISASTGTVRLKAQFANAGHRLWPGQLVNVRLLLQTKRDVITVPTSALQ